jgi:adenylate cyclase
MPSLPAEIQQLFQIIHNADGEAQTQAVAALEKILLNLSADKERYEDLLNTFFLMANAESQEQLISLIVRSAQRITGAGAATFFQYLPEKNVLCFYAALGDKADALKSAEIKAEEGIVGEVIRTKNYLLISDVTKEKLFNPEVDKKSGFTTRSILCVPVLAGENVLGAIQVLNKNEGEFNLEDIKLLLLLAQNIAIAHRLFKF